MTYRCTIYTAYRLRVKWVRLPYPLLAIKCSQLLASLLALPCSDHVSYFNFLKLSSFNRANPSESFPSQSQIEALMVFRKRILLNCFEFQRGPKLQPSDRHRHADSWVILWISPQVLGQFQWLTDRLKHLWSEFESNMIQKRERGLVNVFIYRKVAFLTKNPKIITNGN